MRHAVHASLPWSDGAAGPLLDILAEVRDLDWMDRGLCAETDPDSFFPEKGGSAKAPKVVCRSCEVRAECLAYALEHSGHGDVGTFGIWGGTSELKRRQMRRQERSAA
jgi:WhiB family redox-sensing transcriptional regulator